MTRRRANITTRLETAKGTEPRETRLGSYTVIAPLARGGTAGVYLAANERVLCYGCAKHHERGSAVCAVTVHQPMLEVENALIDHLQQHVLSEGVFELVLGEIRNEVAAQLPKRKADVAAIEAELATARAEQKRIARAVAMVDDVAELASELRARNQLIANLEGRLIAAKRTPEELVELISKIEATARERLRDLRSALADRRDLREVFVALFPGRSGGSTARRTSKRWSPVPLPTASRPLRSARSTKRDRNRVKQR